MSFLKATVATAAVITCCFGNDYPAHAKDAGQWDQGYASGYAVSACIHYVEGTIPQARFIEEVQRGQQYLSNRQQDGLILGFRKGSSGKGSAAVKRAFRQCYDASQHLLHNTNSSHHSTYQ